MRQTALGELPVRTVRRQPSGRPCARCHGAVWASAGGQGDGLVAPSRGKKVGDGKKHLNFTYKTWKFLSSPKEISSS